ncbi:MAG: IPT/TIG domain-containing protein, partial [Gammaproteobacteria bacterium]|nr:IPT/TIG domain-containing protein [Gammaproteobacteria bacterium]
LALGGTGIITVDVTDPVRPQLTAGMEAFRENVIETVVAGNFAAYGGGVGVVQVTPDVVLKIHRVDPESRILDLDALGELTIFVRFNKAIDLAPQNLEHFAVLGPDGTSLPVDVEIINNDAILTITDSTGIEVGDVVTVVARAGIESIKPLPEDLRIVLFTLAQDQRFPMTFRGDRPDEIRIEAVVPRRIPRDKSAEITISGIGIPSDINRVKVFVGDRAVDVLSVETNDDDERVGIITAALDPLSVSGQFDVTVQVEKDGLYEHATLYGGLMVDAPVRFDDITPDWGRLQGGTTVTITGDGFEPGNTVMEGLKIRVGSVPVASIRVFANDKLQIVTRGGRVGRNDVFGEDRYGNETSLTGLEGFGFGLKQISTHNPSLVFPSDVFIDQETGVAISNGGFAHQNLEFRQFLDVLLPENFRAASYDIQDPLQPILVGGSPSLPQGSDGRALLGRYVELSKLLSKELLADLLGGPGLSEDEQRRKKELEGTNIAMPLDSIRLHPTEEWEEGVLRKRLYVASGPGGVARLNLDDQNSLQALSQALDEDPSNHVGDIHKWGHSLFAARALGIPPPEKPPQEACQKAQGPMTGGLVERLNYLDVDDPVYLGRLGNMRGGNVVKRGGEWLYSGGLRGGFTWNTGAPCNFFGSPTGSKPKDAGGDSVTAVNLFDRVLTQEYAVTGNVHDINIYGDYLIAGLGSGGVVIIDRDRPERRTLFNIDTELQPNKGRAVQLERFGNLLFVSSNTGGLVVLDIADPLNPFVVSAGNTESIESVDVFKGRLVAAGGFGLRVLNLPGSFVRATSHDQGELMAEDEDLTVIFNERITQESLLQPGAINITELGSGADIPFTLTPVELIEGHAEQYRISFTRTPGEIYKVRIDDARNLRSGALWQPFVVDVEAAAALARRPEIREIEGGVFHRGANQEVIIKGAGFRNHPDVRVFID